MTTYVYIMFGHLLAACDLFFVLLRFALNRKSKYFILVILLAKGLILMHIEIGLVVLIFVYMRLVLQILLLTTYVYICFCSFTCGRPFEFLLLICI